MEWLRLIDCVMEEVPIEQVRRKNCIRSLAQKGTKRKGALVGDANVTSWLAS